MCNLLTDPYCAKIKFYRKPRYTHFCSVWNIILSSLYQKCTIWIAAIDRQAEPKEKIKTSPRICSKSPQTPRKSLNWSKTRRWNFTWLLVNRWQQPPRWKAIGSKQMVTLNHRIRWNLKGEKIFSIQYFFLQQKPQKSAFEIFFVCVSALSCFWPQLSAFTAH